MATTLQLRRYNTATIAGTTGADGEVLVDTTKKTLVVQDGSTAGGTPLATETFVTSAIVGLQTSVSAALLSYTTNANLTSTLTNFTINKLSSSGYTLTLSSNGALIPGSANMDLGTSSAPFRSLYITNQTFYFGNSAVSIDSSNTFSIVTGSSTSTLVNTVALNTATSAVQSNITVLLYTQVSSVSSSVSFQVNQVSSNLTQQINQVSSNLITYVDTSLSSALTSYVTLDSFSSTLTSLGTVSDLNLSSAGYIIFSGPNTQPLPVGPLFSSASIGTNASSILIRNPSFSMGSSVLNLTSGSTLFADVSSSGTSIQLPFDVFGSPSWVSSYGSSIVDNFQFYGNFGSGSSYTITSSVNTSYTHTLEYFANSANGHGILYEGSDFNIVSGNLVVYPSIPYVYHWILYETSGTTTSVLLIPITPNTDTQNNWSGNPVYFNNLDVGYTTSSSNFNGSDPGKMVPVPTLGQPTFTENGHQVWPAGWLQTPNNFYLQTSSTGPTFEFTTGGTIVLPAGGDIVNSSGNSVFCGIPCPTSSVPATVTSTGTAGQLAYSSSYVYICVATNTWRRANLSTW